MHSETDDIKLPALREASSVAVFETSPGSELMNFLAFLRAELLKAVEILREETHDSLSDGDAADRIQILNRLRLRANRVQAHLVREIKEIRELTRSLKGHTDKAILEALVRESREVTQDVGEALTALAQEFGVE